MTSVRMERTESFFQEKVGLQPFDGIQLNHFKRVHFFLKNGLSPNMKDAQKRTLLMCSCSLANQDTAMKFVNLLLSYKARIEFTDVNNLNALHHAVLNDKERIVSRFLEFSGNFDLNSQDNDGNTALMLAVRAKNYLISEQIILALRRYDLSVDITNNQGITPLIQATILGENEIAKCLMAVGRASEQIRDTHFRKSASEWGRMGNRYPAKTRGVYTCPPQVLHLNNDQRGNMNKLPKLSRNATSTRFLLAGNNGTPITESYKWPDLKRVYQLYESQITSSYRKSVPPRAKTPPPPSELSSEGTSLWRKTALNSMRLKQRRHTIALSRSLPNNLSTKFIFARRSIADGRVVGRSSIAGTADMEDSKWPSLRQSYLKKAPQRRKSDFGQAPSTAPGGLDSSLFSKRTENLKRRNSTSLANSPLTRRPSVTFQSSEVGADKGKASAVHQSPAQARRSSMKNSDGGFRNTAGETSLPILEHEEEFEAGSDHETE